MKRSLIALALLACAMALAHAAQPTTAAVIASMKVDALASSLHVESVTPFAGTSFVGSLTFTRVNKGGLARDSP